MSNKEIKNSQDFDQKDTLATMVAKKFGINRNTFKATNKERLAQMAAKGGKKDEKYTGTFDQNMRIRDRILKNDIIPVPDYKEAIKSFSPEKQKIIQNSFQGTEINSYISSLPEKTKQQLNTLSPAKCVGFLHQEIAEVKAAKEKVKKNMTGMEVNDITSEQIINLGRLSDLQERLDSFASKNTDFQEFALNKQTRKFNTKMEADFQVFLAQAKKQPQETNKLLETYGSEKGAEEYLRYTYALQQAKQSPAYTKLGEKDKTEFDGMVVDFSRMSKNLGIDISALGAGSLIVAASEILVNTYSHNDSYQTLLRNINGDQDVKDFFKKQENTLTELVPETGKNKLYYSKLLSLYPTLNTTINNKKVSDYLNYLKDDMQIKEDTPQDQKDIIASLLPKFKEQTKGYEKRLLDTNNALTQEIAVQRCVSTLQQYMDVNISEKDNILQQLKVKNSDNAVSSVGDTLMLRVDGTINGKKVTIAYDLKSGKVSYQNFLSPKADTTIKNTLCIDSSDEKNWTPLMTLPSLGDTLQGAKHIDCTKIIASSSTLGEYEKNYTGELQKGAKINAQDSIGDSKDILKKEIIKDMIVQNIVSLTGKDKPGEDHLNYTITKEQQPQAYTFYDLIYQSLDYYSMRSLDALQSFQASINAMLTMKQEQGNTVLQNAPDNQERSTLRAIINTKILSTNTDGGDKTPETTLLSFFKCFEQTTGTLTIIDVEMMKDYFATAQQSESKTNTQGAWKKNAAFATLTGDIATKVASNDADEYLKKSLNDVNIT